MSTRETVCLCVRDSKLNDKEPYMLDNNHVSVGNAGEYFVAGELERHGFTVAVPMSNVKDFDILAISRTSYKQYAIQVKTTQTKNNSWPLKKKNETLRGDNIFYVFVSLNEMDSPEYHIVPSHVVADTIASEHKKWLDTPGKNGQQHNDSDIRKFSDEGNLYLDKWDYLK